MPCEEQDIAPLGELEGSVANGFEGVEQMGFFAAVLSDHSGVAHVVGPGEPDDDVDQI